MNTLTQAQYAQNMNAMRSSLSINFEQLHYEVEELMFEEVDNKALQQIRLHIAYTDFVGAAQVARKTKRDNLAAMLDALQEWLVVAVKEHNEA